MSAARRRASLALVNDTGQTDADLSVLSDESLWCRTERHKWEWERDVPVKPRTAQEFERVITCERCGVSKVKTISTRSFTVVKVRSQGYPPGYLIKGSGRIPTSAVYREQYLRHKSSR